MLPLSPNFLRPSPSIASAQSIVPMDGTLSSTDLFPPFFVEQFAPAFNWATGCLGVVSHGIGVVPGRNHDDEARRSLHLPAILIAPHPLVRSCALPDARFWRQLSSLGEVGDFVPVLDPLRVN